MYKLHLAKMKTPFIFKLLMPLIVGVVIAFYAPVFFNLVTLLWALFILFFSAIFYFVKVKKTSKVFGVFISLFFVFLGAYLVHIKVGAQHQNYFFTKTIGKNDLYVIRVLEVPETKENSIKCIANVLSVNSEKSMGKVVLYFERNNRSNTIKYGDIIAFNTSFKKIKPNGNPKEFDYSRYLKIHNIIHQSYVKDANWSKVDNKANSFFSWIYQIRKGLDHLLEESGMSSVNLMVARALILGEKESLDKETLRTFSSAGAMHVLAVSGLHVGIVMLIFSFLLKPIKRVPNGRLIFIVTVVILIWLYALITGLSSSVLRASVMFSFVIIGKELERETSIYQSIMVSAFLLILIEPLVLFQVGFQLSYMAVLGIVFLQPKIYTFFYIKNGFLDKIWQISSVSLAAQLATFPLGIYYFHQFPNFFMISNLIVIPLAFAILIVGISYFLTFWIPGVSTFIFYLLDFLLTILNKGVKWVEQLPHSIYWGFSIHWFEVFWLYVILLVGIAAFLWKNKKLLMTTMVLIIAMISFNIWEKEKLDSSKQLVFYNVNKSIAIDMFTGRENVFLADEKLLKDEDKLLFNVKHNWFYRRGEEKARKTIQLNPNTDLIQFGNKKILFLTDSSRKRIPKVSYVYLHNLNFLEEEIILDIKNRNVKTIIGNRVGYKLRYYLRQKLKKEQIHELKEQGAYVIDF